MTKNISPQGAEQLKKFKFKGGSVAYSYKYLWSPLAEKALKFVPITMSPNLITFLGTLIHIFGNLCMAIQEQGKLCWPPSILIFGLCVFIYYTMDNVDGKQARRTGNSTPLGMCMDHGCDALGVSFLCIGLYRVVALNDNIALLLSSLGIVLGTFWFSAWYQYHNNGVLFLGKFNAVDDGVPAVSFMGIATFFFGQEIWLKQHFGLFTFQHCLIVIVWVAGIGQIISLVGFSRENFTKDIKGALFNLIHFPLLILSLVSVIIFTNWHNEYFIGIYFSFAFVIVRNTSVLHVCVCTKDKFNQWQLPTIVVIIGFPIFAMITYIANPSQCIQLLMVYSILLFSAYNYFNYVINTAKQMAKILSIKVFSIRPQIKNKTN